MIQANESPAPEKSELDPLLDTFDEEIDSDEDEFEDEDSDEDDDG